MYVDQDDKEIDIFTWAKLMEDTPGRTLGDDVLDTNLGRLRVRTMWLGVRMPELGDEPFGTAVGLSGSTFEEIGQWPTREAALDSHRAVLAALSRMPADVSDVVEHAPNYLISYLHNYLADEATTPDP